MMVRNDRLPDCPFVASIKERLASPRPWFKVLVYVAAKLVRIATALLKYGETFSFEKAGISKAVLKQWELEQAKAAKALTARKRIVRPQARLIHEMP